MKSSIQSLLDAYVHGNAEYIKENGGNVAEYILNTSEAEDQGWHWFLSDEEIEEYESNPERRAELIVHIRSYVNKNYNYNILADELLEKWIVVQLPYADKDDSIRVTRRSNFEEMNYCDAYGNHGQKVACYNAGCHNLENSASTAQSDCATAISEKFNVCVSLEKCADEWTVTPANDEDDFSDEMIAEIETFIKEWQKENTSHTEVIAWTYHNSKNFETILLKADFHEPNCVELDEDKQIEILLQMPESTPHIEGTNVSEESENFIFRFDRWATNPWFCYVERK